MSTPSVLPIIPLNTQGQELTPVDEVSVSSISVTSKYNVDTDYIKAYLYDINDNLIGGLTTNYSITSGKISGSTSTQINLDPAQDLASNNYTQGTYKVNYNFLSSLISGAPSFNITETSSDRTELRVSNSSLSSSELQAVATTLTNFLNSTETFQGFDLDFGNDIILLVTNVGFDGTAILIKLYQPLPTNLGLRSSFFFVEKKSEPVAFILEYPQEELEAPEQIFLKGPNLNIQLQQESNTSTGFQTLDSIYSSSDIDLTNQLNSILVERRAELNTDYSDFINFIFFSSAEQRLINFYDKASLIENYNNQIASLNTIANTTEASSSKAIYQTKINDLITNFDGYDYYLYFDSSSQSWPKSNSTPPYTLYSTGSTEVLTWYSELLDSGSLYDERNPNYIYNIYPQYITEDIDNDQFKLFNEMVAQMFDQIWLYTQAIENRQDGDNRLSEGISIDLAADALRSYGITLYESNLSNNDLYTTYLGINPAGGTLPPTGSELITNYVTASAETTPFNDAQKLVYKRLYHNLPYLLKKKGTVAGLQLLIDCFGVPDTILRINEFGGKDKNPRTWDQWQNSFDYSFYATGSTFVSSSWALNTLWNSLDDVPQAVEFRFKTDSLPTNTATIASQSLWTTDTGVGTGVGVALRYNGSGYTSGSYSGSVVNPYQKYGYLDFYPNIADSSTTCSVYLPFFDGGWWSVMVNKDNGGSSTTFQLIAKNNIYTGADSNILGFQASASVVGNDGDWNSTQQSYLATSSLAGPAFTGSLQEWRYYATQSTQDTFDAYVMNPASIEQSQYLAFRATLGGELYTGSSSVHPKVSGVQAATSSFASTSNFYYKGTPLFVPNNEVVFYDQVLGGIKNIVSNKVKLGESTVYGKVLSGLASLQQNYPASQSYTSDVNYMEVGFSPANEINEDINSQFGYINIGEYIGDPRFISQSSYTYPELNTLSFDYFKKYGSSYDLQDYFRLIKYFDNSLFKMIKDFVPARASVATGAIVKQHLLERNRQRPAQIDYTQPEYTGSVTSLARDYQTGSIEVFTGGAGGSVNVLTNISQSWTSSILTKAGLVTGVESSQYEFFNGEYSGSNIPCHLSYSLNTTPLLNNVSANRTSTFYEDVDYGSNAFNPVNLIYIQSGSASLAAVQDSNYAITSSWSQLRYEGSANVGNYNTTINFASQSQAPGYPIDKFTNYFARFSYDASSDPEYPGGGVFKLVELINIDGTRIPLIGDNKYLSFVSEIFKAGKTVTAYGRNVSVIKTITDLTVVEGGGYYQTMLLRSGSSPIGLNIGWSSGTSTGATGNFVSSNITILTDSASIGNTGFIYTLQNSSSATYGTMVYMYPQSGIQVYNKATDSYAIEGGAGNSWNVAYKDTLFPLKYGDFIRFGNTGSYSFANTGSLDDTFTGAGLYYISRIVTGSDIANSGSIIISPALQGESTNLVVPSAINNQNYRLIRRVESETWVTTKIYADMNVDPAVGGLLIPNDFNPAYDPIVVARQAGIEL
jgi:hypothetical protein